MERKYKVRLNSIEKLEELLQETYDLVTKHLNEIQLEINKLVNSTTLSSESTTMDEKAKYAKAMHDYIGDQHKAISLKLDVAKLMDEVIKHNGDVAETMNDNAVAKASGLDFNALRAELSNFEQSNGGDDSVTYDLKK